MHIESALKKIDLHFQFLDNKLKLKNQRKEGFAQFEKYVDTHLGNFARKRIKNS